MIISAIMVVKTEVRMLKVIDSLMFVSHNTRDWAVSKVV